MNPSIVPWKYWARWVAVFPAALAAYFGLQIIYALTTTMMLVPDWMIQLINSGMGAYGFMYAGTMTAPDKRFGTCLTLAIIFCSMHLCVMLLTLGDGSLGWLKITWLCICSAVSIGTAIVVTLDFLKDSNTIDGEPPESGAI